nr:hypothetical protein CFP56_63741 [Quercus suber]
MSGKGLRRGEMVVRSGGGNCLQTCERESKAFRRASETGGVELIYGNHIHAASILSPTSRRQYAKLDGVHGKTMSKRERKGIDDYDHDHSENNPLFPSTRRLDRPGFRLRVATPSMYRPCGPGSRSSTHMINMHIYRQSATSSACATILICVSDDQSLDARASDAPCLRLRCHLDPVNFTYFGLIVIVPYPVARAYVYSHKVPCALPSSSGLPAHLSHLVIHLVRHYSLRHPARRWTCSAHTHVLFT